MKASRSNGGLAIAIRHAGRLLLTAMVTAICSMSAVRAESPASSQGASINSRADKPERWQSLRNERREQMIERLEDADRNNDGMLSRDEVAHRFPRLWKNFDAIDENRDGMLSPSEIRRFWEARARERRIQRDGRDPRD